MEEILILATVRITVQSSHIGQAPNLITEQREIISLQWSVRIHAVIILQ